MSNRTEVTKNSVPWKLAFEELCEFTEALSPKVVILVANEFTLHGHPESPVALN